jgi:hypothetical protein
MFAHPMRMSSRVLYKTSGRQILRRGPQQKAACQVSFRFHMRVMPESYRNVTNDVPSTSQGM